MIGLIVRPSSAFARSIKYHHTSNGKPSLISGHCTTKVFKTMRVYDSIFIDVAKTLPNDVWTVKNIKRRINKEFDCYFHVIKPRQSGDLLEIARLA